MKSLPEITQQVSNDEDVTTINATLFSTYSENQQHFPSTELGQATKVPVVFSAERESSVKGVTGIHW